MNNNQPRSIQVLIVASPLVAWGLERLVQSAESGCDLAGTASAPREALRIVGTTRVDVLVVASEDLPTAEIAEFCAECAAKVLLVTHSADEAWLDNAVISGVRGVVRTGEPASTLLKAIAKVQAGELWIDRSATTRIFLQMARRKAAESDDPHRSKIATLTARERQTIAALTTDAAAPGKVIADRLCISEHTLRNHLTSIYNKLGLSNRLDLYAYATRHRLHELR